MVLSMGVTQFVSNRVVLSKERFRRCCLEGDGWAQSPQHQEDLNQGNHSALLGEALLESHSDDKHCLVVSRISRMAENEEGKPAYRHDDYTQPAGDTVEEGTRGRGGVGGDNTLRIWCRR